jgi:4-amino-4-deoxy-L-arabinose transferase-like glycosyltransferase
MAFLQDWIHNLEVGPWFRKLRIMVVCLVLAVAVGGFNLRSYRNMSTQDAMDTAQVARNVSEGKGFTTLFIRPLSVHLVKKHNEGTGGAAKEGDSTDYARLKGPHPDLANPPLYPCVLAGWMKVYPLLFKAADGIRNVMPEFIKNRLPEFNLETDNRLWQKDKRFWWAPHDFMIAMFNEVLLFIVIWLTFLLARRLFDRTVAWMSAVLLLGSELLWRFSVSGLSTMLLLAVFMGLVWCLVFFESEAREPKAGPKRLLLFAGAAGLMVGIGVLTRYAFGWLIIPVVAFLVVFGGQQRVKLGGLAFGVFLVMLSPWVVRNVSVSGTPFGTAGFSVMENSIFNGNRLERSLNPQFDVNFVKPITSKLIINSRSIVQNDLPRLAGSWVTPLFLVGLMLPFNNLAIRRLRYLILACLAMLVIVQALGYTHLSDDSPEINSENLLVLLAPLVLVFGVSLFFVLLGQLSFALPVLRYAVVGLFAVLACLPMVSSFLPPRTIAPAYPPYFPPRIQLLSGWMKENELMMSDIPWAVAWYGNRQCILMTRDAQDDFFAVNDYLKPVRALYLTQLTMDSRFLSGWVQAGERSWGSFVVQSALLSQIPPNFPLRIAPPPPGFLPEQLFLTDWERWKKTTDDQRSAPDEK